MSNFIINQIRDRFRSKVHILDGGLSTYLVRLGHQIDSDPLWSARVLLEKPDDIKKTHTSFLEHGADIITTATYQASLSGFQDHAGLTTQKAADVMRTAVKIACTVRDDYTTRPLVGLSVGPYGATLHDGSEYTGSYIDGMTEKEICDWHAERIREFLGSASQPDLITCETIPSLKEAVCLLKTVKLFPHLPVWMSFSCKDGQCTNHGELLKDAVEACLLTNSEQLVAVGVNCTNPCYVTSLLKSVQDIDIPFVVYPNSGEQWDSNMGWFGEEDAVSIDKYVPTWLTLGTRIIGGCCRVYPENISKIREAVNRQKD